MKDDELGVNPCDDITVSRGEARDARFLSAEELVRVFYPAVEHSGIEGTVKPHDLRHTSASLAIAAGADPKAIQYMMGHRSMKMTWDIYGHLWPDTLDDVAVKLNAMLQSPLKDRSRYTFGAHETGEEG